MASVKKQLKVLHIAWEPSFGGLERLVIDLSEVQKTTLDAVLFFAGKSNGKLTREIDHRNLLCLFGRLNSGYDLMVWKYYQIWRMFKQYDILHFHTFNLFVAICAIFSRKRIVYTIHGGFALGRKKRISDFVKPWLMKVFLNRFVSEITTNSYYIYNLATRIYKIRKTKKCQVVYNGISFRRANDEVTYTRESDTFLIGGCGRLAYSKKFARLLKSFACFYKNNPKARLLIVGDGPEKPNLEKLSVELKIKDVDDFVGYQSKPYLFYPVMDLFVLSSQGEPFGLVVVEALLSGTPAIVFADSGGAKEIVTALEPNDVVDDENHLVQRLQFYQENTEELKRRAPLCEEHAEKFSLDKMSNQLYKVYQSAIS